MHNFFATFIEVLRDRPPGHDWELEPGVTCGDYLFGMLQVSPSNILVKRRDWNWEGRSSAREARCFQKASCNERSHMGIT